MKSRVLDRIVSTLNQIRSRVDPPADEMLKLVSVNSLHFFIITVDLAAVKTNHLAGRPTRNFKVLGTVI